MWFKNLLIYRFKQPWEVSEETLHNALLENEFTPCGSQDLTQMGWVPVLPKSDQFCLSNQGRHLFNLRKQQKLLPAAAVNEVLDEKVRELEDSEARKVYRKERATLKDEVIQTLLPRALTRSQRTWAYVDPAKGLLVVDCSARNRAEELLTKLRDDIETLPVVPLQTTIEPVTLMTEWLQNGGLPEGFTLGRECELRDPLENSNVVRCKDQDLFGEEIATHLAAGKQVVKLAIEWKENLHCIISGDLSIKRLKFTDLVLSQSDNAEDAATQLDQDFALMGAELGQFIAALTEAFGGVLKDGE